MSRKWVLPLWWGFLFFYGLDAGPAYRTEGLRARIAAECFESGDWLVPTLCGEPYLTKPPGHYAAICVCSLPAGRVTDVTARLPSAAAGFVTVYLLFLLIGRSLTAGLLLPVSFLWLDKAPSAEIDMLQVMWVTMSLTFGYWAVEKNSRLCWAAAMLAVAGGFLTKWTAPAFFYCAMVPYSIQTGRGRQLLSTGHILGVTLAAAACAGWVAAVIHAVGPNELAETVRREAMQRIDPHHAGRAYPWGEALAFPLKVLAANGLWGVLAVLAARRWRTADRLTRFLHCWAWPNLLFWSLMSEHAVRYAMPMCPAAVGLGVLMWLKWVSPRKTALLAVVLAWAVAKVAFVEAVWPMRTDGRRPRETAAEISQLVPAGEILYIDLLKDEGILFYYGRSVRKAAPGGVPADARYAVLLPRELPHWPGTVVRRLRDQQGDPFVLVRLKERR